MSSFDVGVNAIVVTRDHRVGACDDSAVAQETTAGFAVTRCDDSCGRTTRHVYTHCLRRAYCLQLCLQCSLYVVSYTSPNLATIQIVCSRHGHGPFLSTQPNPSNSHPTQPTSCCLPTQPNPSNSCYYDKNIHFIRFHTEKFET